METTPRNKAIGNKDFQETVDLVKKDVVADTEKVMQTFFFPTLGVNIEAFTLEEAVEKLNKIKEDKVN